MKKKKNTQSEGSFKVLNMDTICLSCITGQENEKYLNPELITHKKSKKKKAADLNLGHKSVNTMNNKHNIKYSSGSDILRLQYDII